MGVGDRKGGGRVRKGESGEERVQKERGERRDRVECKN